MKEVVWVCTIVVSLSVTDIEHCDETIYNQDKSTVILTLMKTVLVYSSLPAVSRGRSSVIVLQIIITDMKTYHGITVVVLQAEHIYYRMGRLYNV